MTKREDVEKAFDELNRTDCALTTSGGVASDLVVALWNALATLKKYVLDRDDDLEEAQDDEA